MSKQRCGDQIKNLVAGSEKKSCMPKIGVCSVLLSEPIHTYLIIKHTHTHFFLYYLVFILQAHLQPADIRQRRKTF